MINAFVLIRARSNAIADLASAIAEIDGVREAHSVAGGDIDIMAIVEVATHNDIATVVTEHISKLDGVTNTSTLIAFRSYSGTDDAASFEGFGD